MPYQQRTLANRSRYVRKRRRYAKRRYQVKKPTVNNVTSAWNMAKKAWMIGKKLAHLVNIETKEFSASLSGNIDNAGSAYLTLNSIAQGDTDLTRDGDSLKMLRIRLLGHVNHNSANTSGNVIRCILFIDKQNTLGTIASFWSPLSTGACVDGSKVYDTRFQSIVLVDKRFTLNPQDENSLIDMSAPINFHTQYSAGSTTITSGVLRLLLLTDEGTNFPSYVFEERLYFVDN